MYFNLKPKRKDYIMTKHHETLEYIRLANDFKDIGEDEPANIIFSKLVYDYMNSSRHLVLELETEDEYGYSLSEPYYDLLVIRYEDASLNIPVPLLASDMVYCLMKPATVVSRLNHERYIEDSSLGRKDELLVRFHEMVSDIDIMRSTAILDLETRNIAVPRCALYEEGLHQALYFLDENEPYGVYPRSVISNSVQCGVKGNLETRISFPTPMPPISHIEDFNEFIRICLVEGGYVYVQNLYEKR